MLQTLWGLIASPAATDSSIQRFRHNTSTYCMLLYFRQKRLQTFDVLRCQNHILLVAQKPDILLAGSTAFFNPANRTAHFFPWHIGRFWGGGFDGDCNGVVKIFVSTKSELFT